MSKIITPTIAALLTVSGPTFAANKSWNITEEGTSGVKGAQGTWSVSDDDAGNITGTANLQLDNGNPLTYKISGSVKDSLYTLRLSDRSDGKKACVWDGHFAAGADKSHGLIGQAICEGGAVLIIRAGF